VKGRERETKRAGRERLRGMGGEKVGGYMYEREREEIVRWRGREREREGGWGGERVRLIVRGKGEIEGREGK
jgi:hypothetical protein